MFDGIGNFIGGGGGAVGGGAGGAMGGGRASTGFGKWYSDMQEAQEVEMTDLESGGTEGGGMWRFWQGSEKKTDGPTSSSLLIPGLPFGRQETAGSEADTLIMGMSYRQRFKFFVLGFLLSVLFFVLAFVVGLPALAFRPSKFALSFTLGSLCFMASFAMLKGPTNHLRSMLALDRLPFSLAYLASMAGTIYACAIKSYLAVVFFSAVQLLALAWYFISFVPGGNKGMKYFVGAIATTARYTLKPCLDVCSRTLCLCFGGGGGS